MGKVLENLLLKYLVIFFLRTSSRPNWKEERKLNTETFGARSTSQFSHRSYRGSRRYWGSGQGGGDVGFSSIRGGGEKGKPMSNCFLFYFLTLKLVEPSIFGYITYAVVTKFCTV